MPNSKYAQVTDLLAQGKLRWATDMIEARLVSGSSFDAADKTLADVGSSISSSPIQGRWVAEGGNFMGQPVFFGSVQAGTYQVVVVQLMGSGDAAANVLAYYDSDENDSPLTLDNDGTLAVRPSLLPDQPEGTPQTSRLWMKV